MQNDPNFLLDFLPIEKIFKLKIFAVLSKHKDIPEEVVQGKKLLLSLTAAYDRSAVVEGIKKAILLQGTSSEDYDLTRIVLERNLDQIVDLSMATTPPLSSFESKEMKIKKGKEEMIAYIRYVFANAGTEEEKVVGERVINKYQKIQNA